MTPLTFSPNPSAEQPFPGPPLKRLAIPRPGQQHTFAEVASLVLVSLFTGLTVRIVCLTQESYDHWLVWLNCIPANAGLLELFDANQATLKDCVEFLTEHPGDIVVLHGACTELWPHQISTAYVSALVETVPDGIVMVV